MELYTSSLNRNFNSRKSSHNIFFSPLKSQQHYRTKNLPQSDLFTWNSLTQTQWLSLEIFESLREENHFEVTNYIHTYEERSRVQT